ncbi:Carboxylesterase family protein [Hyunsoonleella jejuensis]|uniref:Carboxylesterase family protein n=2 Tax=Hyunsoonleella jejuensis TaxID=419940 RepID=A0A1H9H9U9_9FLAO|nr:Carboxylesterase family protein [Hyunsoonleella jejuensis]
MYLKIMKVFKLLITLSVFISVSPVFTQVCADDNRFESVDFFSSSEIDSKKNLIYGSAINGKGTTQDLAMDLYFPNTSVDKMYQRPLVLLIHGGGFQKGKRQALWTQCQTFAKRGYVVATISYRLGFDPTIQGDVVKAVYRAQQDANTALRFLVAHAKDYKIDTSWIFIGGYSAGSITAFHTVYASQAEWNALFPSLETELGALNSSGNNLTETFSIRGIFNNWGSVNEGLMKLDEMIPTISFHGELDNTVNIDLSPNGQMGSRAIHKVLEKNNICNDFTMAASGKHVVFNTDPEKVFTVNRASCFFKSLFCDNCTNFYSKEMVPASCSN